ncbi:MAG: hypothetical protein UX80_C0002G0062 [Candidatus Amesbacteria bacterium GW2011_GWA2_47_11b]|uniref:Glycosyltransferase RgtA/B/C/D-like domain-containing protein n=3 Tax=Candidatus Amesiibacteriota TaxID=1752730 RepID=A0A0G1SLR2_9BACT|nr:MAG: hypothetical protein UT95_C0003G0038 [Candidatus Curtissbacteria bacterium GW2011_GWB1_40_28]KKU29425.1 MAG: hypothetical protein UX42_C0001G0177 [Microgenomates group bacterium GW2011_GWC1_46_20]KKU58527.1 MAG: hypothetical protein UX80_C0002G0062 [Candidatus Amesbacteria bacterium GW2011_GWA2_47_11b]KKU70366.1 MAG: hypothetical protein UX92_C0001G0034 [Candidatus Amesbacteria bacterium GW2011_GWA1_47_20]KKU83655.1 MAG: hypothetical protein UY11_C0015G0018 [Candidatus Amesbacteria bact
MLFLVIASAVQVFILSNVQFTPWPEMLLWPWLINQGWVPFTDLILAHTPLLYLSLSLWYRLVGPGLIALKIFTWIYILITATALWIITIKQSGKKSAAISLLLYFMMQTIYQGNGVWFDLALAPMSLLIYYFLTSQRVGMAGILFSVSFFIKQTSFWLIFPIIWQLLTTRSVQRFLTAAVVTSVIILSMFALIGILDDFYLWTIRVGVFSLSRSQWQSQWPTLSQAIVFLFLPFVVSVFDYKLAPWIIFASLGVFPRWELFHFQPALPFLVLGLVQISIKNRKFFSVLLVLISLLYFRVLIRDWGKPDRFFDPDTLQAVQFIQAQTKPSDNLYVFNYWDHIYFLSNRLPATRPYVPSFPVFLNISGIQLEMVKDLEANRPPFVVYHPLEKSGYGSYNPRPLWDYLNKDYQVYQKISDQLWILKRNE